MKAQPDLSGGTACPCLAEPAARHRLDWTRLTALTLPLILWLLATFYYGGQLGRWMDDYSVPAIDPVTGHTWAVWVTSFPRPLGWTIATTKASLLFDHDAAHHLISALMHGVVTLLLWLLLRSLTRTRHVPAAVSLAYLTFPLHYEIIFWTSAMHAGLATGLFLVLLLCVRPYALSHHKLFWLAILMLLTGLVVCLYEQPASGVLALPLLYMAFCSPSERRARRLLEAVAPTLACGVVCLLYVLAVYRFAAGARGGEGSYISADQLLDRLRVVYTSGHYVLLGPRMRALLAGGWSQGIEILWSGRGLLWALVMLVLFQGWVRDWCRSPLLQAHKAMTACAPVGRLQGVAFGTAIFCLGWVPVVLIRTQTVEARLFYYPLIGAAIVAAICLDAAACRLQRLRGGDYAFKLTTCLAVAGGTVVGAVCLVAIQFAFQERYRLDQYEIGQLQQLVPDPQPGAVFVPLRTMDTPTHTGRPAFDQSIIGAFATSWSGPRALQIGYRRMDLSSTFYLPWGALPLRFGHAEAKYLDTLPPFEQAPDDLSSIPYSSMIPFVVDERGRVKVLGSVWIERSDGEDQMLDCPSTGHTAVVAIRDPEYLEGEPVSGWQWERSGMPVHFGVYRDWGLPHLGTPMHPVYPGDSEHSAMKVQLPADPRSSRIVFRATFTEYDIVRGHGDGVDLRWYLAESADSPAAMLHLSPVQISSQRRWLPIVLEVPPLPEASALRCEVTAGAGGNFDFDGCLVSQGYRHFSSAGSTSH